MKFFSDKIYLNLFRQISAFKPLKNKKVKNFQPCITRVKVNLYFNYSKALILINIFFVFIGNLDSKPILINNVKYLNSKSYKWEGPANIKIDSGKILSIETIAGGSGDINGYLTPSFCDAQVTLGMNSLDGSASIDDVRISLKSFLAHGFTHILSTADSPWIQGIKKEVDSGKTPGPTILISEKPILYQTKEYESLPQEIYFTSTKESEIQKELERQAIVSKTPILVVHRYFESNEDYFQSYSLNKLLQTTQKNKKILSVATFADKISILDTLQSGIRYLQHPIPAELEREIQIQHFKEMHLMPLLNVYRNLGLFARENGFKGEFDFLQSRSQYFAQNYFPRVKDILKPDTEESFLKAESEYNGYLQLLKKYPDLSGRIILGSGSGHKYSFPGISGIQEMGIYYYTFGKSLELLKIPIHNTCSYLGLNPVIISPGSEANLILFKEDPSLKYQNLFSIEKVFLNGKEMYTNQLPFKKK